MRKALAIIVALFATAANAGTTTFRDNTGRVEGYARESNGRTTYYDRTWRPQGYATHQNGAERYYDKAWRPTGSSNWSRP